MGHSECVGPRQEPAVNLATVRNLSNGRASFGKDMDRLVVSAVFGPGDENRVPLIEIPNTDRQSLEAADRDIKKILEGIRLVGD